MYNSMGSIHSVDTLSAGHFIIKEAGTGLVYGISRIDEVTNIYPLLSQTWMQGLFSIRYKVRHSSFK